MPIYEPDLSYEDMKKAVKSFKCAKCGNFLLIAWSAQKNSYMLRCGQDLEHNGVVPWGRDPELLEIANKLRGRPLPMETTALTKLTPEKMLARVNQARFPKDLTVAERALIAKVSIEYGLDPLFNELMIYQGRPYVTIDARRRKAQETGELDGVNSRPSTQAERKERNVAEGDYLYLCQVWRKGCSHPFEGWGKVRLDEIKGDPHLPVVKDPGAQAEKRAEAQALRRAFHLPLPSAEDIVEGEFRELPDEKGAPESKSKPPKEKPSPPAPTTNNRLTPAQHRKIGQDAEKMGYTEKDILGIIKKKWGVEHVSDLTVPQASTLIDMIAKGEGIPAEAKNDEAQG